VADAPTVLAELAGRLGVRTEAQATSVAGTEGGDHA